MRVQSIYQPNVMMMMIMIIFALILQHPMSQGDPNVVKMVHDVIREKKWDYLTFLSTANNDLMTLVEVQKVLAGLIGSMSASLVLLDGHQNVTITPGGMPTLPIGTSTYRGTEDKRMVIHTRHPKYRAQFLILWDPTGFAAQFMEKASDFGLFTSQQEWLIILPQNVSLDDFSSKLTYAKVFVDSEVTVCSYEEGGSSFSLRMTWRVGEGIPFIYEMVGSWSPTEGLELLPLIEKYDRRKDLHGVHLRVATIISMPYVSMKKNATLQNFQVGYVVDVWHTLQEQLNFTYTATDTLFGSLQNDGVTWNGMVGLLQTGEADAAVAPLSITKIRVAAIDFTLPIQIVSTRLYIRRPTLESTWTLYVQPFGTYMWICTPLSLIVLGISLWLYNKISNIMAFNDHEISLGQSFLVMIMSLFQQPTDIEPKPISGKIVFFAGFWNGMILFNCYSGILVSILTTRQPQLPFKDFEGLLKRPDWNLGVRTNTALADSLALAPKGTPMRLSWEKMVGKDPVKNLPYNNDDALTNVLKGKYTFFANKEYIIYRIQRALPLKDAMNIVDTKTDFLRRGIGFGLQKRSPYKKLFNHVLTKMTQKGHLERLKQKWWPNLNREPDPTYPSPGFKEVFTLFIIWSLGIITSVLICVLEQVIDSQQWKRKSVTELEHDLFRDKIAQAF